MLSRAFNGEREAKRAGNEDIRLTTERRTNYEVIMTRRSVINGVLIALVTLRHPQQVHNSFVRHSTRIAVRNVQEHFPKDCQRGASGEHFESARRETEALAAVVQRMARRQSQQLLRGDQPTRLLPHRQQELPAVRAVAVAAPQPLRTRNGRNLALDIVELDRRNADDDRY